MRKAMLAEDADHKKLRYPFYIEPKIDGVRALHQGRITGRSLEPFANKKVCEFFNFDGYKFCDGEMAAERETHPDLCRITSSALSTIEGDPYIVWHLFDYFGPEALDKPYKVRLKMLVDVVMKLPVAYALRVRIIPFKLIHNYQEFLTAHEEYMRMGYEGSIIRDPEGMHKDGRSTVREMGLLREKEFMHSEAIVVGFSEGKSNGNVAKVDARGYTKRSTHAENMVPNGEVGTLHCKVHSDIYHPRNGKLLFRKDFLFDCSPGKMTQEEAALYFQNPDMIIDKIIKFQHFPHGVKTKPRMATFHCIRMPEDM